MGIYCSKLYWCLCCYNEQDLIDEADRLLDIEQRDSRNNLLVETDERTPLLSQHYADRPPHSPFSDWKEHRHHLTHREDENSIFYPGRSPRSLGLFGSVGNEIDPRRRRTIPSSNAPHSLTPSQIRASNVILDSAHSEMMDLTIKDQEENEDGGGRGALYLKSALERRQYYELKLEEAATVGGLAEKYKDKTAQLPDDDDQLEYYDTFSDILQTYDDDCPILIQDNDLPVLDEHYIEIVEDLVVPF